MTTLRTKNSNPAIILAAQAVKQLKIGATKSVIIRDLNGKKRKFRIVKELPGTRNEVRCKKQEWYVEGFEWLGKEFPENNYHLYRLRLRRKDTPNRTHDIFGINLALTE